MIAVFIHSGFLQGSGKGNCFPRQTISELIKSFIHVNVVVVVLLLLLLLLFTSLSYLGLSAMCYSGINNEVWMKRMYICVKRVGP